MGYMLPRIVGGGGVVQGVASTRVLPLPFRFAPKCWRLSYGSGSRGGRCH